MNSLDLSLPFTKEELLDPVQASRQRALSMALPGEQGTRKDMVHPDNALTHELGSALRAGAQSAPGRWLRQVAAVPFNHGAGLGTVVGLAGGGALGYGLGKLLDKFSDDEEEGTRPWLGGALGAVAGGLGGHLLGALREKAAALLGATNDDVTYVQWRVRSDPSLSSPEKQAIASALRQLGTADLAELADLLRTAAGAGVGLLVAKFLMKAGLGGMLLGALTGGFVGARMGGPSMLGNSSYSGKTDAYGNAYTF
jgi:hypothetical protein